MWGRMPSCAAGANRRRHPIRRDSIVLNPVRPGGTNRAVRTNRVRRHTTEGTAEGDLKETSAWGTHANRKLPQPFQPRPHLGASKPSCLQTIQNV